MFGLVFQINYSIKLQDILLVATLVLSASCLFHAKLLYVLLYNLCSFRRLWNVKIAPWDWHM